MDKGFAGINPVIESFRGDAFINLNKALMHALGLHEAVLYAELLSRYVYFESRGGLTQDGYFYNTVDDLKLGTVLGDKSQRSTIRNLIKSGLIEVRVGGVPAKRYFRIVNDLELLQHYLTLGKAKMRGEAVDSLELVSGNGGPEMGHSMTQNGPMGEFTGLEGGFDPDAPIDWPDIDGYRMEYMMHKNGRKRGKGNGAKEIKGY